MTTKKRPPYSMSMPFFQASLSSRFLFILACLLWIGSGDSLQAAASNSVARVWNERAIAAIRVDTPNPPVNARTLFSLSVCMYDAWAAYDTNAVGFIYRGKHTAADITAARNEAIS